MEWFVMVCHGMVPENSWDMLTNMLTVDTTTALGQVDMSFCIHTLFIYEASWEQSKGATFADRYADS